MTYTIEVYECLCSCKVFRVNGEYGDAADFGEGADRGYNSGEYGCTDYHFTPHRRPPEGVLEKYGISRDEFDTIADELEEKLSFGACNWCT